MERLRPTIPSLTDALCAIGPDLPTELVDFEAHQKLVSIARRVPNVMTTFGFECRLAEGESTVDLGLAIMPANGGRDAIANLEQNPEPSPVFTRNPRWSCIRDFARRWSDSESPLYTWVPFVFMEFDAASAATALPVPSLFVALDAPLEASSLRGSAEKSGPIAALREACERLSGRPLPPDVDEQVVRAFETLPEGAWVMHVGVLLGREARGVRLSVSAPGHEVADYLCKLGGDDASAEASAEAVELVERLGGRGDSMQVDFDLQPALRARLGFGLQPGTGEEWEGFLDEVEARGWCTRDKKRALLRWPGRSAANYAGERHGFERSLSHVKLICSPREPISAKAYFGATPLPRAPSISPMSSISRSRET